MDISTMESFDGKKLALYKWDKVKEPKAVVKICHGMAEHCARYDEFAKFLNSEGYIVVASDHRGHGQTDPDSLGYSEGDMFLGNRDDQIHLAERLKIEYNLPVIYFGHSYGSFVGQSVMQQENVYDMYILCGSNKMKGLMFSAGAIMANSMAKKHGDDFPAVKLEKISFGGYEKKIKGKCNWLSRDANEVAKYIDDPHCGFVCSAGFYKSFMGGIKEVYKKENYEKINLEKPVLLIAGGADPVGGDKGVNKLFKHLTKKVGVQDVNIVIYPEARHEILNETNKEEVYNDVADWLNGKFA